MAGKNFTLENLTIRNVRNHGLQIQGEQNADNPVVRNVVFQNTGEQMLKVSYDASNPGAGSDNGLVEHCLFEYTEGVGPRWYIGGIDVHNGKNWVIRGTRSATFKTPERTRKALPNTRCTSGPTPRTRLWNGISFSTATGE